MDVAIEDAFAETKESFESACAIYPDKQICFTELGWATRTAHDDHADYASVANQKRYLEEVADYLKSEEIVGFVFEAFDELWKDPSSPAASECNWGIYDINRKKKWERITRTAYLIMIGGSCYFSEVWCVYKIFNEVSG